MANPHPRSRCPCGSRQRFKNCCMHRKAEGLSITFDLGEPKPVDGVSISPGGQIQLMLGDNPVTPLRAWIGGHRDRTKGGKKDLFNMPLAGDRTHLNELGALADYDYFFVIDTNTQKIGGVPISVASVAICSAYHMPDNPGLTLFRRTHAGAFEFRGLAADQERLGWLLIQHAITNGEGFDPEKRYLIVSDHALRSHQAINERQEPLFGDVMLAKGISLGFATGESGRSVAQKILRECDGFARTILKKIKSGAQSEELLRRVEGGLISHIRLYQYRQPIQAHPLAPYAPVYVLSADLPY
jgi:hypothetical protein